MVTNLSNVLYLSSFVFIPLLMLLGLWLARNIKQVRGVMVAGSSALLLLAVYLVLIGSYRSTSATMWVSTASVWP